MWIAGRFECSRGLTCRSDVMFLRREAFSSTDVREISGQRAELRRRQEAGRLFDWTIASRQKSSFCQPFPSGSFFFAFFLFLLHLFRVFAELTNRRAALVQTTWQSLSIPFFFSRGVASDVEFLQNVWISGTLWGWNSEKLNYPKTKEKKK